MQILIIGSGAREHALAWKINQSTLSHNVILWPPHPAMPSSSQTDVSHANWTFDELRQFAQAKKIDLIICGPEKPLAAGLQDSMSAYGIKVFGPSKQASQLEASKIFAKNIMIDAGIPTAPYTIASNVTTAQKQSYNRLAKEKKVVIKADGLAAGKGVFLCNTRNEIDEALIRLNKDHSQAASKMLIESQLFGRECSYFALINGRSHIPLGFAVDFKKLSEDDMGPNTGGMGAYTPVPWLPKNATQTVTQQIVTPLLQKLLEKNIHYCGFLYCGLMWTKTGPLVIEFNVRLGDPEAQALAVSDQRDWLPLILDILDQKSSSRIIEPDHKKTVAIVMASKDYPYCQLSSSHLDSPLPQQFFTNIKSPYCFGASLQKKDHKLYPGKGRLLTVVSRDSQSFQKARHSSLSLIKEITHYWPTALWRKDIAQKVCVEEQPHS